MEKLIEYAQIYGRRPSKPMCYYEYYEKLFSKIDINSLLEVGIQKGDSLRLWKEYLEDTQIIGLDNKYECLFNEDRIKTYIVDQSSRKELERFIEYIIANSKAFDIIIDDGGHHQEWQQLTFGLLFKTLKFGGYYVIEDINTSLSGDYSRYNVDMRSNSPFTTLKVFEKWEDKDVLESLWINEDDRDRILHTVESCKVYKNLDEKHRWVEIKKRDKYGK